MSSVCFGIEQSRFGENAKGYMEGFGCVKGMLTIFNDVHSQGLYTVVEYISWVW